MHQWYMHKPESVIEDKTHKISWDFETQKDHLISAKRKYIVIIHKQTKKRPCRLEDLAISVDHSED